MKKTIDLVVAVALCATLTSCTPEVSWDADSGDTDSRQPLKLGISGDAGSDWSRMVALWTPQEREVSFGMFVCLDGATIATIEDVLPLEEVGEFDLLEPLLVTLQDLGESFISDNGYPPPVSTGSGYESIRGAKFVFQCGDSARYQQLAIGLRASSDQGGGWRGAKIRYTVDGNQYELVVPNEMLLCGSETVRCDELGL
ncbi:MAG TPA: hypothetical protein PKE40_13005 [Arachnia sp.]|nr:hypothetical protein [Arachnia sp.]HMT87263.1 hypothetical protein [Arachnia sp.]